MTVLLETTTQAELEALAQAYVNDERPKHEIHHAVDHLAHPSLSPTQAWAAFEDLPLAMEQQDDLDAGRIDYTAVDDDLTDPAAAHDILRERIQDALTTLTGSAR